MKKCMARLFEEGLEYLYIAINLQCPLINNMKNYKSGDIDAICMSAIFGVSNLGLIE